MRKILGELNSNHFWAQLQTQILKVIIGAMHKISRIILTVCSKLKSCLKQLRPISFLKSFKVTNHTCCPVFFIYVSLHLCAFFNIRKPHKQQDKHPIYSILYIKVGQRYRTTRTGRYLKIIMIYFHNIYCKFRYE